MKPPEKERVGQWNKRTLASGKTYEDWETEWSCKLLEDYYYGKQWQNETDEWAKRKYVINLFYPSINISKPSLLFQLPKYKVTPRPTRMKDPLSDVEARAKLQEETLNSLVQDPKVGFAVEAGLALLDSQFRFGMMEVGYTADFIDNPNAGKPVLRDQETTAEDGTKTIEKTPMTDRDGVPVGQANAFLNSESLFVKWIDAKQVRVGQNSKNRTASCDWIGYFEWHHIDDLKANKNYKNTAKLNATGRLKNNPVPTNEEEKAGMVKVWKIWDLRTKTKLVFPDGGEKFFQEKRFTFLPLSALKFDDILGQWLPLPPTYNWAHPQNELNDTREMQRVHRKRAIRRYLRRRGRFTEEEWTKLCEGDDMVSAEVDGDLEGSVKPMDDAPLDRAVAMNVPQSTDDFIRVSGISGESQQIADSDTATQANLIALAGKVREAAKRLQVALWLSEIGRLILLTVKENMALPVWISKHVDPYSPLAGAEAQEIEYLWQQISAEDIGSVDNDITVDLTSISPVAQEQERTDWMTFLTILTSTPIAIVLTASPYLLRKTAGLYSIHSERDLVEVSKALMLTAMSGASQPQQGQPGEAPTTPNNSDIVSQLTRQLPVEASQAVS